MSDSAMVLSSPDGLRPVPPSTDGSSGIVDRVTLCESPTSSSPISSPSTSTTSSSSTTPNNDGDDKATETTPFIDPEDVIGRRVMFELPPLRMDSGWGVPADAPSDNAEIESEDRREMAGSPNEGHVLRNGRSLIGDGSLMKDGGLCYEFSPSMMTKVDLMEPDINSAGLQLQILTPSYTSEEPNGLSSGTISTSSFSTSKNRFLKEIYEDVGFIHWNWPLIRRCCQVTLVSVLVGLLCIAIALIATAPRTCAPPRDWWQGGVFYEIVPSEFGDGSVASVRDLVPRLDGIIDLGIAAVRLDPARYSDNYQPSSVGSWNRTFTLAVDAFNMDDFERFVQKLHSRNVRVVVDLNPVFVEKRQHLNAERERYAFVPPNFKDPNLLAGKLMWPVDDTLMLNLSHGHVQKQLQDAMRFWLSKGVDGFVMNHLEYLELTPQILFNFLEWRSIMDGAATTTPRLSGRKILSCSARFIELLEQERDADESHLFAGLFDLMEYELNFESRPVRRLCEDMHNMTARQLPAAQEAIPMILWSVPPVGSSFEETSPDSGYKQSLAALLFSLMLPGTVNVMSGVEMPLEETLQHNHSSAAHLLDLTTSPSSAWEVNVSSSSRGTIDRGTRMDLTRTCRSVILLRNSTVPLYVSSAYPQSDRGSCKVPNYRLPHCTDDVVALERFYPRWNSFVAIANFGNHTGHLDLSSKFYKGTILASTERRYGNLLFKNMQLQGGEVLIVEL